MGQSFFLSLSSALIARCIRYVDRSFLSLVIAAAAMTLKTLLSCWRRLAFHINSSTPSIVCTAGSPSCCYFCVMFVVAVGAFCET